MDDLQRRSRGGERGENSGGMRGLLVGALCVPLTCFLVSWAENKLITLQIGFLQMPPAAVGVFLVVLAMNALLRRAAPRLHLRPVDLLIAYSMTVVAALISSRGLMQKLLPLLVTPDYFTDLGAPFRRFLPAPLFPFDVHGQEKQDVSVRFFERLRAGETIPWQLWVGPVLLWSLLVGLVFGGFLFMAALLRKQWMDNEKLSFPLAEVPLQLASDSGDGPNAKPLLRDKRLWAGAALPTVIFLIKGLHTWYPSVPDIPLEVFVNDYLPQGAPWDGASGIYLKCSLALIGFMFLLPSDLVFSLWFFFVFSRVQDIAVRAANWDMPAMPLYPCPLYRGYQALGAYLVLGVYFLSLARPHLKTVWRVATNPRQSANRDDAGELFSYPVAFWGFWACFAGATLFLMAMGLSPLLALLQMGTLFFVIAFVLGRASAEAGFIMTESSFRPIDLLRLATPLHTLGPQNLTVLALSDTLLLRDQRGLLFAGVLDGLRLHHAANADTGGNNNRRPVRLAGVYVCALVLSMLCAAVIQIWLPYRYGGITLYTYVYQGNNEWAFNDYKQYLQPGAPPLGWQAPTFLGVGVVVTSLLVWGRIALASFPFHPLGYALCSSWTINVFWFPALVAWVFKTLILRYGGMKLYKQARPYFLGLIVGEFALAFFWTLMSALFDTPTPPFPWA